MGIGHIMHVWRIWARHRKGKHVHFNCMLVQGSFKPNPWEQTCRNQVHAIKIQEFKRPHASKQSLQSCPWLAWKTKLVPFIWLSASVAIPVYRKPAAFWCKLGSTYHCLLDSNVKAFGWLNKKESRKNQYIQIKHASNNWCKRSTRAYIPLNSVIIFQQM